MKTLNRISSGKLTSVMPMSTASKESSEAPYFTSGRWTWSNSAVQKNSISYFRR